MRYIKTFENFNLPLEDLDEKTIENMLEDAVNNGDYELEASLRDLLKSSKKEDKEEVVTIEDWNKY